MFATNGFKIIGTGSYTPETILSNSEIATRVATSDAWIRENLGIRERRICFENQFTSDIATLASLNAVENAGIDREEIDLIILATATPDRKAPSSACLLKHKLEIQNNCPAFDISAVCSGFMYGLSLAADLLSFGKYRKILLVGADTFSKITDWERRDCVFFGDGAGAVILEASENKDHIFSAQIYSNTRETDNFTVYPDAPYFTMNGKAVYETGTKVLPESIKNILYKNNLSISDVKYFIPHQPSIKLLTRTAELLDLPLSKLVTNMDKYANTSGGTIPILLDETHRGGLLHKNDLILFAAVGSGWTWGAAIYRWI